MDYDPRPIDTSQVDLDAHVRDLLEQLAENTHDVWARQRFADGWHYGPRRDDERREHPGLVPYEKLPEKEKEYDRQTALAALETIVALGYRIEQADAEPAAGMEQTVAGVLAASADQTADVGRLVALWRGRDPSVWSRSTDIYVRVSTRLLTMGAPIAAHEVLDEGLGHWPDHVRLRQLQALALARLGCTDRAQRILIELYEHRNIDEETIGLLARTYKDQGFAAEGEARRRALDLAYDRYNEAYQRFGGHWMGINAATLALLRDDRATAHDLARRVVAQCQMEPESEEDQYWRPATLGEAYLILERWNESAESYRKAYTVGHKDLGNVASTRRNAQAILAHLGKDRGWIDGVLPIPRIVLFVGHMVDRAGRETPRFPPEIEEAVKEAIAEQVRDFDGRVGYSSAACGSDILFLEVVARLGGQTHIVLPAEEAEFRRESVDLIPGANWSERFSEVLDHASDEVITAGQMLEHLGLAYEYANMVLQGLAEIRARELGAELVALAFWDGKSGDGPGGTASTVERWREAGYDVHLIDPGEIIARTLPAPPVAAAPAPKPPPSPPVEADRGPDALLAAVLFADVVKFSQLSEAQIPAFVEHFLGAVGKLTEELPDCAPIARNTWGDGLYFVFEHVRDAGLFALALCERVQTTDWTRFGLPAGLNLRVGLHAGPVYCCTDPITRTTNYIGSHVSRGARIEPITPAGQVYASQAFAALASVERITEFECEYVKRMEWAKRYGSFPTYVVRRRA